MTTAIPSVLVLVALALAWLAVNVLAPVAEQRRDDPQTARRVALAAWVTVCAALIAAYVAGILR